jgi:hypothetical protein
LTGANDHLAPKAIVETIVSYINQSSGLRTNSNDALLLEIFQQADGKKIWVSVKDVEDVIPRCDGDGRDFLQVNFHSGTKILITDDLIGFKPSERQGLDMEKLPKVVTTPDLVSVFEAIQEALHAEDTRPEELDILRKVFESVVKGGEAVGFDLSKERLWYTRLPTISRKATA